MILYFLLDVKREISLLSVFLMILGISVLTQSIGQFFGVLGFDPAGLFIPKNFLHISYEDAPRYFAIVTTVAIVVYLFLMMKYYLKLSGRKFYVLWFIILFTSAPFMWVSLYINIKS